MPAPSKPDITPPPRPRDHRQEPKPSPESERANDPRPVTTRDGENPYLDTEGGE